MEAPITIEEHPNWKNFILIEAFRDGRKHTVAMLPIAMLSRDVVTENARIIQLALIEARIKEVGKA